MTQSNQSLSNTRRRLPFLLLLGGILILLIAIVLILTRSPDRGTPSLAVDQLESNFGDVKLGEYVTATFQVTNRGDARLVFSKAPYIEVREGC